MTDVFIEQLVHRKKSAAEKTISVIMVILTVFITIFSLFLWASMPVTPISMILRMVLMFFIVGIIYLCYRIVRSTNIEYEYAVTNGTLDIDRIVAKSKRNKILAVEIKQIEEFGKYAPADHENRPYDKKLMVGGGMEHEPYYFVTRLPKFNKALVVFEPDERTLNSVLKYVNRLNIVKK